MKRLWIVLLLLAGTVYGQHTVRDITNRNYSNDYVAITKGLVSGKSAVTQYGINKVVGTSEEAVITLSGTQEYLPTGAILDVVSTAAADDTSGTGARTITIKGLDEDWESQSETVTLSGADTVQTTNKFVRVFDVEVITAGSGLMASDTILVQNQGNDTTLALIVPDNNEVRKAIYTVPLGKTFYVTSIYGTSRSAVASELHLYYRTQTTGLWHKAISFSVYLSGVDLSLEFPLVFAAQTDLELRAIAASSTSFIVAGFEGWIENE